MANIRKQFNFRNGVQIDDDNLVVSPTGLVGIGTTIPTEALDVRGTAKVVGLVTASQIFTPNLTATTVSITSLSLGDSVVGGGVSIRSGIVTASGSGVVTYYGDGGRLSNLPTSQWLDVDVGLGFTSIYAQGFVGISTNDPRYPFQVGGTNNLSAFINGVGINSNGNIVATGIVTGGKFVGIGSDLTQLNASNIAYGTISNDRIPVLLNSKLPSDIQVSGAITATSFTGNLTGNVTGNLTGNVTGNLTGNVTGIASTARSLTGNPDILVNNITATSIAVTSITNVTSIGAANINVTGVATATRLNIGVGGSAVTITSNSRIGIGSTVPTEALQIISNEISTIEVVGTEARLILAEEKSGVSIASSSGVIRYGNADKTFELLNQAPGNFNSYLHSGGPGINTGRFGWVYGQNFSELMSLTYTGRLGLGRTDPVNTLHVVGTSTVTGNAWFGGNVTIAGNLNIASIQLPPLVENSNIYVTSGLSTFNNANFNGYVSIGSSIGIGTNRPIIGVDATNSSGIFQEIGIGFTNYPSQPIEEPLHNLGRTLLATNVGIGTTVPLYTLAADPAEEALVKIFDGYVEVENGEVSLYGTDTYLDTTSRLGVGTTNPLSGVDFANAGRDVANGSGAFMIVPRNTTAQRTGLATQTGAVIFNTSTGRFQGYTGTTWVDFH